MDSVHIEHFLKTNSKNRHIWECGICGNEYNVKRLLKEHQKFYIASEKTYNLSAGQDFNSPIKIIPAESSTSKVNSHDIHQISKFPINTSVAKSYPIQKLSNKQSTYKFQQHSVTNPSKYQQNPSTNLLQNHSNEAITHFNQFNVKPSDINYDKVQSSSKTYSVIGEESRGGYQVKNISQECVSSGNDVIINSTIQIFLPNIYRKQVIESNYISDDNNVVKCELNNENMIEVDVENDSNSYFEDLKEFKQENATFVNSDLIDNVDYERDDIDTEDFKINHDNILLESNGQFRIESRELGGDCKYHFDVCGCSDSANLCSLKIQGVFRKKLLTKPFKVEKVKGMLHATVLKNSTSNCDLQQLYVLE